MNSRLVGRPSTLAMLGDLLSTPSPGSAPLLLVGERGVGRSVLLHAARDVALDRGFRVIEAGGCRAEVGLPYAGLERLLQPVLGEIRELPAGPRCELLTALGARGGDPPDPVAVGLAASQLLAGGAVGLPLVALIDDLQWLDPASLDVITFAIRRLETRGLVTIAAWSSPIVPAAVSRAFGEHRVERLDVGASRELLTVRAPDLGHEQIEWVLKRALGNPLALVQLAGVAPASGTQPTGPPHLLTPLPPALLESFSDGLEDLPEGTTEAVLVAALDSADSLPEVLSATALLTRGRAPAAILDPAVERGLLSYDDKRVQFRHPLVRSAIVQQASAAQRRAAHRSLGKVITLNSSRRTWHRASGSTGHNDGLAAELEACGSDATRLGDGATAVGALHRAAQLSSAPAERGRRLLLAAERAASAGWFERADQLRSLAARVELSELGEILADIVRWRCGEVPIDDDKWVQRQCRSVSRALILGDAALAIDVACAAAIHSVWANLNAASDAALIDMAKRVAAHCDDVRAVALAAMVDPGRRPELLSTIAGLDPDALDDPEEPYILGVACWVIGDLDGSLRLLDRAETLARARNRPGQLAAILSLSADARVDRGDWARADAALAEAGAMPRVAAHDRAALLLTSAKLAALRGDEAGASQLLDDAQRCAWPAGGRRVLAFAQVIRAISSLSGGRHLEAMTLIARVFDADDPSHHTRVQQGALTYLVEAALRSHRRDVAARATEGLQTTASAIGSCLLTAQLQYARAVLADEADTEAAFLQLFASDLAAWPWPRGRAQLAYGRWLRRHGQLRRSRTQLVAAAECFDLLGAAWWSREAIGELGATARRSAEERDAVPSLRNLSAQEFKVARLAAEGLSNTEIGRQLYLSPRTVGSHLYRIFPKLNITSRSQLRILFRHDAAVVD